MSERNYRGFWGLETGTAIEELADFLSWKKDDWLEFEKWMDLLERQHKKRKRESRKKRRSIRQLLSQLIRRGVVEKKMVGRRVLVRLSDDAWRIAQCRRIKMVRAACPAGVCIVAYDIPEREKHARHAFRHFLKSAGFNQIQRSVWQSKFDVARLVRIVIAELGIEDWVTIIEGKTLD